MIVSDQSNITELRAEAKRLGVSAGGGKVDLFERIKKKFYQDK